MKYTTSNETCDVSTSEQVAEPSCSSLHHENLLFVEHYKFVHATSKKEYIPTHIIFVLASVRSIK